MLQLVNPVFHFKLMFQMLGLVVVSSVIVLSTEAFVLAYLPEQFCYFFLCIQIECLHIFCKDLFLTPNWASKFNNQGFYLFHRLIRLSNSSSLDWIVLSALNDCEYILNQRSLITPYFLELNRVLLLIFNLLNYLRGRRISIKYLLIVDGGWALLPQQTASICVLASLIFFTYFAHILQIRYRVITKVDVWISHFIIL